MKTIDWKHLTFSYTECAKMVRCSFKNGQWGEFYVTSDFYISIHAAATAMTAVTVGITDWDDGVVYQMLEKVTVLAGNRIKVTFRNGVEIEQSVDQPKRRKFA